MIPVLLLQGAGDWPSLPQMVQYGPTIIILVLLLGSLIRLAPVWKEIRLKELDIRAEEATVKGQQAAALSSLAQVLKEIAVEQRRATETIEILQRVNAQTSDQLTAGLNVVERRIEQMETKIAAAPVSSSAAAETRMTS